MRRLFLLLLILIFILAGCSDDKEATPIPTHVDQSAQTATPATKIETPAEAEISPTTQSVPDSLQDLEGLDGDMERIVEFLTVNKNVQMATVGMDGKPSIRTIWFQFYENGRIYFQTDKNSSLYQNLVVTPYIEFVSVNEDNTQTLRIRAEVAFDDKPELLERVLTKYPTIKKYYDSIGNPDLTMFYLKRGSASIFEFSDERQETTLLYKW